MLLSDADRLKEQHDAAAYDLDEKAGYAAL